MLHAVGDQIRPRAPGLGEALYLAGSTVLTLGFGDFVAVGGLARAVVLAAGASVDDHQGEPRVGDRLQDVAERQHGVVEHLAARGRGAQPVPQDVRQQHGRDEQGERVRHRVEDERGDRGTLSEDALPEVAGQHAVPEVQVLLPQRHVEAV